MEVHCSSHSEVLINATSAEKSQNLFLLFFFFSAAQHEKPQKSDLIAEIRVFPCILVT